MTVQPLADGFCFGEGARWFEGLVWFSDMLGEAVHTVTLHGEMSALPLPGHAPSGLGFRPDGTLLIVSSRTRQVLSYDGESVSVLVDLTDVVPADLGDMVIDARGRAYIGSQARLGGMIVRLDPDDRVSVVADDLEFPNGMAISPDGTFLIAESTARRLSAFAVDDAGRLYDRRVLADGLDGPPDGLAVDAEGGVWAAMTLAHQFQRFDRSGTVTDCIDMAGRTAIACALGGPEGRTLFLLSSTDAYPERLIGTALSTLDAVSVDVPAP